MIRLRRFANAGVAFVTALFVLIALILWRVTILEDASEREDRADRTVVLVSMLRANLSALQSIDREFLLTRVPHSDRPGLVNEIRKQFGLLREQVTPEQQGRLAKMHATYGAWLRNSESLMRERSVRPAPRAYSRAELRETVAHSLNDDADLLLRAQIQARSVASSANDAAARDALIVTVVATFAIVGILAIFVWTSMLRAHRERERSWEESRALKEAQRRSAELEEQNIQIRETARIKSDFVAHMSHELRTPLTAILGLGEMLYDEKAGPLSGLQKSYLNDILMSGRHLLGLISEVLDLAKLEAGKIQMSYLQCDPCALAQEVVDTLRPLAQNKSIALITELEHCPKNVVSDPSRLRQVLYNYVSNAVKFTQPGGTVTVRVMRAASERLRIEVKDTGIGIAHDQLQHLFRDFSQVGTGSHEGAGLGLALTKRIVELQGGFVGVSSEKGMGSLFYAEFPMKRAATQPAVIA